MLGALTIATIAAVSVTALDEGSLLESWRSVFASHAASVLVIVPVAMTSRRPPPLRNTWEIPVQVAALVVVTLAVFSPDQSLSLTFVPLPFLVWAALRFDLRTVSWELAGFSVLVTFLCARSYGPFGFDFELGELDAVGMGAIVQGYLLCAALMTLPLAIAIDQRRRALEQLTRSELLFRRNFTESLLGMVLLRSGSSPFEIVDLNEAAARIVGGTGSPLGRDLGDVLLIPEPVARIAGRLVGGDMAGWKTQTGLRDRPGARVKVAVSLLTADPEPVFAAQLQDITTEYDAHRQLEAAERLTSATLDTAAAIIFVTDLTGRIVRVNAAAAGLTGYAEEELLGRLAWELAQSPGDAADVAALFNAPGGPTGGVSRETVARTKDGTQLRVIWNSSLVRDEHDEPAYVVVTGLDVTAERTAAGMNAHLFEAAITTALIGIDTRGVITVFNPGAQKLLGHNAAAMVGQPFIDLLDPVELRVRAGEGAGAAGFASLVADLEATRETPPRDWTWIGRDGTRHTVSMTLSVAADESAAQVGYLCVGRDVTESRASQEMLIAALEKERTAVERLRQLDDAKNQFISTVSHELRTPVTSIVGYTELLQDGAASEPDPAQLPLMASISRNAQRLISICDDLLTLGGLDAGATRWSRETVDLASVLPAAEDTVRPLLVGRDLTLTFAHDPEPVLVLGDRLQLERVLTNLLGNAVKFTEDGGRIECRVERHDDEAWLVVTDTGIGIPAEEQAQLFQRFFRSSTAQQRAIQGTGLGLSIVSSIVAAHGGRIEVRSAHLEGTTFTVRLPLTRGGGPVGR